MHQNMPSSITPSNVMPIVDVGASKLWGRPSSHRGVIKSKHPPPLPLDRIHHRVLKKAKASPTPVSQTIVNQKESKISKLSASNQRRSKHNASAKKKTLGKLPNTNKVMSDQEKKSIELKLKSRERAWITVVMCSVF